jgi:hypothetical protein
MFWLVALRTDFAAGRTRLCMFRATPESRCKGKMAGTAVFLAAGDHD